MRGLLRVVCTQLTWRLVLLCGLVLPTAGKVCAQTGELPQKHWLEPSDTLNKKRFWTAMASGTAVYAGVSVGLYHAWYKQYPLGKFQTFDDSREWLQMDKTGHLATAYHEARLVHDGARWTGLDERRSIWIGVGAGTLLQGTVEVMDGFSEEWGFSWTDVAFNTAGVTTFAVQQALWGEQRVVVKVSSSYRLPAENYLVTSTNGQGTYSLRTRDVELYGEPFAERFLKDYNSLSMWFSANVRAFAPDSRWPRWLNVAAGYSAENLYGGFGNTWQDEAGNGYALPADAFPRYRQYLLSLDVDLQRIPTRRRGLKLALSALNFIKIPAPALEFSGQKGFKWHWLYY